MKVDPKDLGFSTRAIHAGQPPEARTGAVTVPIFQTSTFVQNVAGEAVEFEYARVQNPTRFALEENVAQLERGITGHAFASGMAAISCLASLLKAGDHAVVSRDVYGGTYRYFTKVLESYQLSFSWIDTTDLDAVRAALTPQTKMIYLETPSNPMMEITDIAAVSEIAHRHGAFLVVDNTFLSPYLQNPLEHGADVVVHSATKFLNGHSDSIGGVLVASRPDHSEWFYFMQKAAGAILSPFDSFLTLRGIKTLAVRQDRHETNAREVADFLLHHPKVEKVLFPGWPNHPGYEIQKRQARGFGSMISFDMGTYEAAKAVLDRVRVISLAESLGGVESLISHPVSMTHASVPPERRAELGLSDSLVRISVGIENVEDLLADLEQALAG